MNYYPSSTTMLALYAVLYLAILLTFSVSTIILRAGPKKFDNQLLAAGGYIQSLQFLLTGFVMARKTYNPFEWINYNLRTMIVTAFGLILFSHSFPFNQFPPRRLLVPLLLLASILLIFTFYFEAPHTHRWIFLFYVLFSALLSLKFFYRNYLRVQKYPIAKGIVTLMVFIPGIMISVVAFVSIFSGTFPLPPFAIAFSLRVLMPLLSFCGVSWAVLRYGLFSVEEVLREVLFIVLSGFIVSVVTMGCIRLASSSSFPSLGLMHGGIVGTLLLFGLGVGLRPFAEKTWFGGDVANALRELRNIIDSEATISNVWTLLRAELLRRFPSAQIELHKFQEWGSSIIPAAGAVDPRFSNLLRESPVLVREWGAEYTPLANELFEESRSNVVIAIYGSKLYGALNITAHPLPRKVVEICTGAADLLARKIDLYLMYDELQNTRRLATLGTMAAAVAHDIRTPLSSIRLNLQVLSEQVESNASVDIALEEVDRLNTLVSELLDFSKPPQLRIKPFVLMDCVQSIANQLRSLSTERQVQIHTQVDPSVICLGDSAQIGRVLQNLIHNAIMASQANKQVLARAESNDSFVYITIEDQGKGIAVENVSKIFEPFFSMRPDGTGLGLAISKKIIDAHHGSISVQSRLGEGTIFTIQLPIANQP